MAADGVRLPVGIGAVGRPVHPAHPHPQRCAVQPVGEREACSGPQLQPVGGRLGQPAGQLDAATGLAVMELLRAVVRSEGVAALVATHDPQLLGLADRVLELSDGAVVEEG